MGAESIVIECEFKEAYYGYKCTAKLFEITARDGDRYVKRVYGQHADNKSSEDVRVFYSGESTVNFFPQNLANVLPNLETIQINYANLKEITSDDLRPFGDKLKNLWLGINDLELIEADLFDYTPNIEWIYLENNKIKNVESGALGKLQKLKNFNFIKNPCHSGDAGSLVDVEYLTAVIEFKCEQTSHLLRIHRDGIEREMKDLRKEVTHLKKKIEQNCRIE